MSNLKRDSNGDTYSCTELALIDQKGCLAQAITQPTSEARLARRHGLSGITFDRDSEKKLASGGGV